MKKTAEKVDNNWFRVIPRSPCDKNKAEALSDLLEWMANSDVKIKKEFMEEYQATIKHCIQVGKFFGIAV